MLKSLAEGSIPSMISNPTKICTQTNSNDLTYPVLSSHSKFHHKMTNNPIPRPQARRVSEVKIPAGVLPPMPLFVIDKPLAKISRAATTTFSTIAPPHQTTRKPHIQHRPTCRRCATPSSGATTRSARNPKSARNGVFSRSARYFFPQTQTPQ